MEGSHSGLVHTLGKRTCPQGYRGFESLPLRQLPFRTLSTSIVLPMDNQSQIDEIKRKIDIVEMINGYTALKKAGRNYKALCPFHNEKTPSFMVSPDRQIFKCFGCSEGGDVFAFYQKLEGVEFGEALKTLADRTGVKLADYKETGVQKQKETYLKLHDLAASFYHYILTKHKIGEKALGYLQARGVNQKSIKDFKLGFAPNKTKALLDFLTKKGYGVGDAVVAGLALTSSGQPRDRFWGRIMFPIFDSQDRVIAFSGRSLGETEPKYLNSPDTPIFNKSRSIYGINLAKQAIKKDKTAVLVEGNFDVISSHQVGVSNTVAPLGTALTGFQVEMIKRWAENLIVAFDTDLAGDAAAKRGIELAETAGLNTRVAHLIQGKDPDEIIKKNPLEWKKAIEEAEPVYDFYVNAALKRFDANSAEGKKRVAAVVLPELARIEDEIMKAHYLQILAAKLGVDEEVLRRSIQKYEGGTPKLADVKEVLEKPLSEKGRLLIEKYLLSLIIQSGNLPAEVNEKLIEDSNISQVFLKVKDFIKDEGRFKVKTFIRSLPAALLPIFDELLLHEIDEELLADEEKIFKEVAYCVGRLKELNLRTKLKDLSIAIKQAESAGNPEKVLHLSEKFRDLSKILNNLEVK